LSYKLKQLFELPELLRVSRTPAVSMVKPTVEKDKKETMRELKRECQSENGVKYLRN
jgi:hypothetical protein